PGEGSEKPDGGERAGAGLTAQDWLVRVLPVALLIVAGLAGLRGAVGTLRWDGPLHRDAVVVGVVLEVVIVTLFVILLVRHGRGRRLRLPIALRAGEVIAEDPEQLREAVESGRSALRTVDDARAAIIACYLAMETTLAERGTARGAAGTPGELLTRATEAGLVRGTAAGQLTALFYEARFSSHPLGHQQRDAAERALDELAADLAETEGA